MNKNKNHGEFDTYQPSQQPFKRCFETHPALPIGDYKVYGGSCGSPIVKDADVYVGLDLSMTRSAKAFPWEEGHSFLFHIQDMNVPTDPAAFTKLIDWLAEQVISNAKVHIGCIGGHGRTGTVLAALVTAMTGEKDSIDYVRNNYCKKAVESHAQVAYLVKHFGIKEAPGAKEEGHRHSYSVTPHNRAPAPVKKTAKVHEIGKSTHNVQPVRSPTDIWGPEIVFDKSAESGIITL